MPVHIKNLGISYTKAFNRLQELNVQSSPEASREASPIKMDSLSFLKPFSFL